MPLSGAERQRAYRQRRRVMVTAARNVTRALEDRVTAGILAGESPGRAAKDALTDAGLVQTQADRPRQEVDEARTSLGIALSGLLVAEGVGVRRLIRHAGDKLQARRLFNAARVREGEKLEALEDLVALLGEIATLLVPILPMTAGSIKSALETSTMPPSLRV